MSQDDTNKPRSLWQLNGSRIVLLILGALLVVYIVSGLLGGLGNYQQLKEAADAVNEQQAPAETPPSN